MKKEEPRKQSLSMATISTAALAAGTGLGVSMPADAAVVYYDITDITLSAYNSTESYALDVDNNGITDFTLAHYFRGATANYGYGYGTMYGRSDISSAGTNGVDIGLFDNNGVLPDSTIDAANAFEPNPNIGLVDYYNYFGNWTALSTGFIGLQFDRNGQNHYGWARISTGYNADITLFDFAFENVAGDAILAGQTTGGTVVPLPAMAPLFAVATGAFGVIGFRRNKKKIARELASA